MVEEEMMKIGDYQQIIEVKTCANRGYECHICTRKDHCKYAVGL